jgi:cytidyltransferase-like protein
MESRSLLRVGIISGYFNPIHIGHIELIERSREVVDVLYVIVNSDFQRELKGSKEFMSEGERLRIVSSIKGVTGCFLSIDRDRSVCSSIRMAHKDVSSYYSWYDLEFKFINGGDRGNGEIPEVVVCGELGIEILDGFGDKVQSSSWLLGR